MNSLSDLKEFMMQQKIPIKEFCGWYLKVGKDTWTMLDGVFYCNGAPQKIKDKKIFDKYDRVTVEKNFYPIKKIKSAKINLTEE